MTGGGCDDNPVQEVCLFSDEEDGELSRVLTDLGICDMKARFLGSRDLIDSGLWA